MFRNIRNPERNFGQMTGNGERIHIFCTSPGTIIAEDKSKTGSHDLHACALPAAVCASQFPHFFGEIATGMPEPGFP